MHDIVDILDDEGRPTGKTTALTEATKKGLWHAAVHVGLYTPDRRVLLQRRSKAIMVYPGLWELGVGGVASAGEGLYDEALRHVEDGFGVSAHGIQPVTRWKYNHHLPSRGLHVKVLLYAFIAEVDPRHLPLPRATVGDIRLLPLREAHEAIFRHKGLPDVQLEPYRNYYQQILGAIERHFSHPAPEQNTLQWK